jgi:signal transduction histidine kinase
MIVLFRDVSETFRLQQIAHRNDRMKELGEMAAKVAHEIRNPLGGIRGYASLLFRDLAHSPSLQEMAGLILEGTKALERLVTTVLECSRPIAIQPETTEVGTFLRSVIRLCKADPSLSERILWQMHIPHAPILAPIDKDALQAALLNLLYNAIQAMPHGGTLTVSSLQLESCCQISIKDTGIGMNEEALSSLFSPFFTTKKTGNGLGLVEAQKIVQAHHGKIDVLSRVGQGTTFTITLPLKR